MKRLFLCIRENIRNFDGLQFDDVFSEKNTGISVYLRDIIKELLITRMECDL